VARGTDVLSQPGDRRLSPLPFAHVGYMTRAWDEIAHGVTTVITPTPWRAEDAIRILAEEAITVAQGVPTQWALMLACPELAAADLGSLRVAGTGAARMPAARWRPCVAASACRWSSATPRPSRRSGRARRCPRPTRRWRPLSAGPVPGVELRIVDDQGAPVMPGAVGRVQLRSGAVMRGYWGRGPGRGRTAAELIERVGHGGGAGGGRMADHR
jgi:acyl-CoA synthetase (AMP-forming)/AMP-acid ligase II